MPKIRLERRMDKIRLENYAQNSLRETCVNQSCMDAEVYNIFSYEVMSIDAEIYNIFSYEVMRRY